MMLVEPETFSWVERFCHQRLLEPIGNIPPTKFENKTAKSTKSRHDGRTHVMKATEKSG
jgi:hypothetical protein